MKKDKVKNVYLKNKRTRAELARKITERTQFQMRGTNFISKSSQSSQFSRTRLFCLICFETSENLQFFARIYPFFKFKDEEIKQKMEQWIGGKHNCLRL